MGLVDPRATPNDTIAHRQGRPLYCPRCGHTYAHGLIVEYWVSHASVFHCWCAVCKESVDISDANVVIGHEIDH
jgi:hypothetical protein